MGTSVAENAGTFGGAATPGRNGLTLRQECEMLRSQVELERQSFITHWRELADYILPRRARFTVTDTNRGDRRNQKIIRGRATRALRILQSGMMAGVTSPARPWFQLATPDPTLNELPPVKEWLHDVGSLMMDAFRKSNLYNALPVVYGDMGVFATGAMFMAEDDTHLFRFTPFAIGEYGVFLDANLRVTGFVRTFRLTVQQVVEKWGNIDPKTGEPDFVSNPASSSISTVVQALWKRNTRGAWIDLVHVVRPNQSYDDEKIASKYKRFEEIYYELGAPNQPSREITGVLSHMGYDEFPLFAPRWEVAAGDIYGTNCPGMIALGDIKELQLRAKKLAQGEEKMINPPMTGPSSLRSAKASILPGDITYNDSTRDNGFRPVHEINFAAAIAPMQQAMQEIGGDIDEAFYKNLFLMITEMDRRQVTATEIDERKQEKLLALGPMLEQLNQDLLDPMIERAFNIMVRKGLIPPAPPELQGVPLKVVYVSIMAQAQKRVGLESLERFAGFVGQVAQFDPSVLDKVDTDEMIDQYGDATGVAPKVVRSDEDVAQLRQQRAQAQQASQAAQNIPGLASAAKDMSETQTGDGSSLLSTIIGRARARQTLDATAQPPAAVTG